MSMEIAARLVEMALNKGAEEAEAYVRMSKKLTIEVKDQAIDSLDSSVTAGYCIRVIKDRRLGFSYSTDFNNIAVTAENAIEGTRYSEPDDYLGLPHTPPSISSENGVKVFDNRIASLSESDAIEYTLAIEKSALKEDIRIKKVRKASGNFSSSNTYIANSRNIKAEYASTACSAHVMAVAEQDSESQMGWDYQGSRFLKEISFEQIGRNASRRALDLLGARKISSLRGFILLDNSISSEFLGLFSAALSAESVQKGKSMLAGKKGEQVLSERLSVKDSGLIDNKLGSRPVDDEGVSTSEKTLIENGVLQCFLYNTYTAKKDGVRSTGNAIRGGYTGLPSVGATNLYLDPVSKEHVTNFKGLVENVDRGVYVIETMGMHTANPITGEFSVGVSGLWIEKGQISYPVKEAVVSGNILDLFKNVIMVGDDLRFYGNIGAPSLLIENIDISG